MQIHLEHFDGLFAPWRGGKLFCGFSGGADSTAALLVTREAAERFHFAVEAVHVNHRLRGEESDREALEAEEFCHERGITFRKFELVYEPGEEPGEERLRAKRLAIWQTLTGGCERAAVVLGHHADDAAENLLLKWGRGGNVSTLTAPAETSTLSGVTLLRPLLAWSRAEIEAFLRENGVTRWAVDSSNLRSAHCRRNELRLNVLPQLYRLHPGFREGVQQSLRALRADAACLDRLAAEKASQWLREYPGGIPADLWAGEMEAIRFRVLKELSETHELTAAGAAAFDAFLKAPPSPETRRFAVPGGRTVLLKDGLLRFAEERPPESVLWDWRKTPELVVGSGRFRAGVTAAEPDAATLETAWFDASLLPEKLFVSPLKAGETMIPFGRTAAESVKKLRTDRKMTAAETPPALRLADGTILWVPKVRHGAHFPVKKGSSAVKMEWNPIRKEKP